MPIDIVMPNLGFDTKEARIVEWKISEGAPIEKGQVIAIIESDKAAVELESIASGVLLERFCTDGETIAVGRVMARVGTKEEYSRRQPSDQAPAISRSPAATSPLAERPAEEHGFNLSDVVGSEPGSRIMRDDAEALIRSGTSGRLFERQRVPKALPRIRKAAREAGIDLSQVQATGPGGTITRTDLGTAPTHEGTRRVVVPIEGKREIPISRMRHRIGQRLSESQRAAPHFYVSAEFDLDAAFKRLVAFPVPQPRINDLIQYLAVQALRQVPALNATFEDDRLYRYESVNLALAVAIEDGLVTPVLHNAERLSLSDMAEKSPALIKRAREKHLTASDLSGGTFTISNLGAFKQVDQFTAVINPPQVAILAVGTVKPRPVASFGGLFVRQTVHVTLSGDHRAVDGVHLAEFLSAFQAQLDAFSEGKIQ